MLWAWRIRPRRNAESTKKAAEKSAEKINAEADKLAKKLHDEAQVKADQLNAEADKKANAIVAKAEQEAEKAKNPGLGHNAPPPEPELPPILHQAEIQDKNL